MHMSPDLRKVAEDNHIHVVIAGHISSDSVGVNLLMDEYERRGVEIVPTSGLIRVRRDAQWKAARRLSALPPSPEPAARPRAELLAPAGGPPALQAALSAGADAVYLGLDTWSARAFAANFAPEALVAAIDRAHLHGARVHLALNVLLKDDELDEALAALAAPYRAGLDALIVADLGFARLVHDAYPALELHASTQLGTHSCAQLERLAGLGFSRAILARELSLDEDRGARAARPGSRGIRARRAVLRLLGRLPAVEHGLGAQRQPRALQPGLPAALPARRGGGRALEQHAPRARGPRGLRRIGRAARRARRRARPAARAVDRRPRRHRRPAGAAGGGGDLVQDRGPHEGRGLRRRHYGGLP